MRYREIIGESIDPSRWPKPFAVITYDEDDDLAHVYRNPPAGLLRRIIGAHDCRALLDDTGALYAWPELNCYHNDVSEGLGIRNVASLMLCSPESLHDYARVSVKGEGPDPEPFTEEPVLSALHKNRGLRELFGDDFPVDTFDWG